MNGYYFVHLSQLYIHIKIKRGVRMCGAPRFYTW